MMRKVVVFLLVLVLGGMVSVCNASKVDSLITSGDAVGKRVAELSGEIRYRFDKVDSLGSCDAKLAEMRRIAMLATEVALLMSVLKELDKVVFGLDLLLTVEKSGGRLTDVSYRAGAELFNKVVKNAEDSLMVLIDCSFCTPETSLLARRVLHVLREGGR